MPWIPFYATESDLAEVVRWLSEDPEIAFIVSAGFMTGANLSINGGLHMH